MPTEFVNAANAYTDAIARAGQAGTGKDMVGLDDGKPDGPSFVELVTGALKDVRTTSERSEAQTFKAVKNETDLADVVTAVTDAELTMKTVSSVRSKIIEAYREIIRMPI